MQRRKKRSTASAALIAALIFLTAVILLSVLNTNLNKPTERKGPSTDASAEGTQNKTDLFQTSDQNTDSGTTADAPITTADGESSSSETKDPPKEPDLPSGKKRIAFTFDDGPHAEYSKKIADEVAKYNGHVTFFVVGNRIKGAQGEGMVYAASKGNEIGIHGYTHTANYANCSESVYQEELSKTADAIRQATGKTPTLMRPIGGSISQARVSACPYAVITWNIDSQDWKYKARKTNQQAAENTKTIINQVLPYVKNGDIILMHELYGNSYDAFCQLLKELSEQGYEFVTVSELLNSPTAGVKYNKANV